MILEPLRRDTVWEINDVPHDRDVVTAWGEVLKYFIHPGEENTISSLAVHETGTVVFVQRTKDDKYSLHSLAKGGDVKTLIPTSDSDKSVYIHAHLFLKITGRDWVLVEFKNLKKYEDPYEICLIDINREEIKQNVLLSSDASISCFNRVGENKVLYHKNVEEGFELHELEVHDDLSCSDKKIEIPSWEMGLERPTIGSMCVAEKDGLVIMRMTGIGPVFKATGTPDMNIVTISLSDYKVLWKVPFPKLPIHYRGKNICHKYENICLGHIGSVLAYNTGKIIQMSLKDGTIISKAYEMENPDTRKILCYCNDILYISQWALDSTKQKSHWEISRYRMGIYTYPVRVDPTENM